MTNELAELKESFRSKLANMIAGVILGLALIIGGVYLANYFAQKHFPYPRDYIGRYAIYAILGVGGPVGGVALIYNMKQLASHKVIIYENGFSYLYGGIAETCQWSQLQTIYEILTEEELKILKVPGASLKNVDRRFRLVRDDSKTFDVNVNSINDIANSGSFLRKHVRKMELPGSKFKAK